jgi:hypothetical protein
MPAEADCRAICVHDGREARVMRASVSKAPSLRLALIGKRQGIKFSRGRRLLVHIAEGHRVQKASLTTRRSKFAELPLGVPTQGFLFHPGLPSSNGRLHLERPSLSRAHLPLLRTGHHGRASRRHPSHHSHSYRVCHY